jgi:hypothetical protein
MDNSRIDDSSPLVMQVKRNNTSVRMACFVASEDGLTKLFGDGRCTASSELQVQELIGRLTKHNVRCKARTLILSA